MKEEEREKGDGKKERGRGRGEKEVLMQGSNLRSITLQPCTVAPGSIACTIHNNYIDIYIYSFHDPTVALCSLCQLFIMEKFHHLQLSPSFS